MHDRPALHTAFADLEEDLFGWESDHGSVGAEGFVRAALQRRSRVRFKTDPYPAVPMGPDTVRRIVVGDVGVNPSAAGSSARS